MKGFLTHAGKASYFEAASRYTFTDFSHIQVQATITIFEYFFRGKSSLLVPLFGDQNRNAAAAEVVGIGKQLDKSYLEDADKLEVALRETLEDEGFGRLGVTVIID